MGDLDRATVLSSHLEPYAGTWISMGVVVCQGPAGRRPWPPEAREAAARFGMAALEARATLLTT